MAAAKRTRSRVCGSRLSCFAIQPTSSGLRERIRIVRPRPAWVRRGPAGDGGKIVAVLLPPSVLDYLIPPMPAPDSRPSSPPRLRRRARPRALARAQASPYLPLDDPRLPLLEHLIARGDIEDPSPMVRPFRRADAVRVLPRPTPPARRRVWSGALRRVRRTRRRTLAPGRARRRARPTATSGATCSIRSGPDGGAPLRRLHRRGGVRPVRAREPAGRRAADRRTIPNGRDGRTSSSPGAFPRRTSAPSSSTAACSTARWTGTGARSGIAGHRREQLRVSRRWRRASTWAPGRCGSRRWRARCTTSRTRSGNGSIATSSPTGSGVRLSDRLASACGRRRVLAGRGPRVRRPLPQSADPAAARQPVRPGRRRQRAARARRALARVSAAPRCEAQLGLDDLQYENTRAATATPTGGRFTVAGFGPLGRALGLARVLHPGLEPGLPHAQPVRELHRRRRRDRPQLRRHGPAHRSR